MGILALNLSSSLLSHSYCLSHFEKLFLFRFAHSTPSLLIPLLSLATKQTLPYLDLLHALLNHIRLSLSHTHSPFDMKHQHQFNPISWVLDFNTRQVTSKSLRQKGRKYEKKNKDYWQTESERGCVL